MISRQHNCLELLEMAQCCYNLHKRSYIGLCPFEVAIRQQLHMPLDALLGCKLGIT